MTNDGSEYPPPTEQLQSNLKLESHLSVPISRYPLRRPDITLNSRRRILQESFRWAFLALPVRNEYLPIITYL